MMERIEIKHFDLPYEKNFQTQESYVVIHDTYLQYVSQYDSEIPEDIDDLLRGWQPMFYDFDLRIKRELFISIEKYWNDKGDHWQLELDINGYPGTLKLYFSKDDKEEMIRVFELIFKWIFNK